MADESLIDLHASSLTDTKDDVDSLPSDDTSSDIFSEADSEAQEEWDRSLEQVQLLLTMILVPWIGKLFGRKFAYWSECCLGNLLVLFSLASWIADIFL